MEITKNSYWIKSGTFSFLQNISTLIFGFGGFYFLVRSVDKSAFGAWSLFLTVTSICEVARVGLVKYSFIKFWNSESTSSRDQLFTASLILNIAFSIGISLVALLFGEILATVWDTPQLKKLFYIYIFTNIILIPFFQFEFLLQALSDFRSLFFSYLARNFFLFSFIIMGYLNFYTLSLDNLAWSNAGGVLSGTIISYLLVRKQFLFKLQLNWIWIKKIFHFGKYMIGTNLSAMLNGSVDQFMLGSLVSTASVAVYNAPGRINNLLNTPSLALAMIVFPHSARLISSEGKEAVKVLYEKSVSIIVGIVLPAIVLVSIFPGWVITFIAGTEYLDSVPILKITILLSLFMPFAYQYGTILDSIGKPHINFYTVLFSLVLKAVTNYYLISKYGIMGAVYGTLCVTVISFIVMQFILHHQLGTNIRHVPGYIFQFYSGLIKKAGYEIISKKETKR